MSVTIVLSGPPGSLIEFEDDRGESIFYGEWEESSDGFWRLSIEDPEVARLQAEVAQLREALSELVSAEWMVTHDWGGDRDSVLEKAYRVLGVE